MKVPDCSSVALIIHSVAILECHTKGKWHDTRLRHCIQTQGQPVVVLFIDVQHHTGIYYFNKSSV